MRRVSSSMPKAGGTMTIPAAIWPGRANSSAPIWRPSRMAISRVFPSSFSCVSMDSFLLGWFQSRHAAGRRIFEMQLLAGEDERPDGMRRERRLGEARQDELQLAGVAGDVADGEDAGNAGAAARRIDADVMALEIEAPFGD